MSHNHILNTVILRQPKMKMVMVQILMCAFFQMFPSLYYLSPIFLAFSLFSFCSILVFCPLLSTSFWLGEKGILWHLDLMDHLFSIHFILFRSINLYWKTTNSLWTSVKNYVLLIKDKIKSLRDILFKKFRVDWNLFFNFNLNF